MKEMPPDNEWNEMSEAERAAFYRARAASRAADTREDEKALAARHGDSVRQAVVRIRREQAIAVEEVNKRHRDEDDDLRAVFWSKLEALGLDEREITRQWMAMVDEAVPLADEYDIDGLDDDAEIASS